MALLQYLKKNDIATKSFLVSKLNLLSQHKLQQAERPYTKSVGDDLQVHPRVSCWNTDSCPYSSHSSSSL